MMVVSGKSTLLEALAVAWGFNAAGGSLYFGSCSLHEQSHGESFFAVMMSRLKR